MKKNENYTRLDQRVCGQSLFCYFKWVFIFIVYLYICHEISKQTKVVLNIFIEINLNFNVSKDRGKYARPGVKNYPNFVNEFLDMII